MIFLYKKFPRLEIIKKIQTDFPNHDLLRFSDFSGDVTEIAHALAADNLFGNSQVVFLSDIDRNLWDQVIAMLPQKAESTIVIWLEESFPVAFLKSMPEHQLQEYVEKKSSEKTNPFTIANHLPNGNAKDLWTTYQELTAEDQAPEALFGIIWWKLKDIAKRKTVITPEFKKTLKKFLTTYSQARETGGDLETGLEEVLLSISKKNLQ